MAIAEPAPSLRFESIGKSDLSSALAAAAQAGSGIKEEFVALVGAKGPEEVPDWWLGAAATAGSFDPVALRKWSVDRRPVSPRRTKSTRISLDTGLRKAILANLGSREEILAAAEMSPESPDLLRSTLIGMLRGNLPSLDQLTRAELAAVALCRSWLEGVVPDLVPAEELRARLARADLVRPFEKLLSHGFVGREAELAQLADYVGVTSAATWKSRLVSLARTIAPSIFTDPPLLIHGPGGIGKSTLVAKFILDQLAAPAAERMTFVYLDFDRPSLRRDEPNAMFLEILRQTGLQHPRLQPALQDIASALSQGRQVQIALESMSTDESDWAIARFAEELRADLSNDQPFLLVLDTFEEIQFLGSDVVTSYLAALDAFYRRLPHLRLIISGRAPIDGGVIKTTPVPLTGFEPPAAKLFLGQYVATHPSATEHGLAADISEEVLQAVARAAGGTPLTLSLAGENLIRAAMSRRTNEPMEIMKIVKSARADRVQQGLYGRILEHLHDPRLNVIAYPGLILRRIDEEVIREVLAPACRLKLSSPSEAGDLLVALRQEMSLVEPEDQGHGIRHRPDVRRLMLDEIESEARGKARRIERRAAAYYRRLSDQSGRPEERAEELYHLMRLERDIATLDERWMEEAGPLLASAVEEIPAQQRIWLLQKLNAGLELSDVAHADQPLWEEVVERRARRLLNAGHVDEALAEVMSRSPLVWLRSGPMFLLTAEIHLAGQDYPRAISFAENAAAGAAEGGNIDGKASALAFIAAIHEALGQRSAALEALARVEPDRPRLSREAEIRFLAVKARLTEGPDDDPQALKDLQGAALALLDRPMLNLLRRRPALLREVAGSFGGVHPGLIKEALNTIGLNLIDQQSVELAVDAIRQWDEEVMGGAIPATPDVPVEDRPILAGLGGREKGLRDVASWLASHRGDAAKAVARLWARYPVSAGVAEKFARLYRDASSRALRKEAAYA